MRLTFNAPLNSVSFGNVAYNFLREFSKKEVPLDFFPIGDKVDVGAYDKIDKSFAEYLNNAVNRRVLNFNVESKGLKLWHIAGSESRLTRKQALFTFHETTRLTDFETNLLRNQDLVFVSNTFSKKVFESHGLQNVVYVPLGFDEDFGKTGKTYLQDKIHFGILGKFEYRKNTARIIKAWLKIFGNNPKYQLSCAISNPFIEKNAFHAEIMSILNGKNYNNINFVPSMNTNSEVNDFLNAVDIDLGGLSGSEGWNLPSFNATCLGKWSVVLNATAHKDWATSENSILVQPSRMKEAHDGIFFSKGAAFNQGEFFDLSDEEMEQAIELSAKFAKVPNPKGEELVSKFSYQSSVESILRVMAMRM